MTYYSTERGETMLTVADLPDGSDALMGAACAVYYHGGQFTAMYALASSGSFELRPGDGFDLLMAELAEASIIAENAGHPDDCEYMLALIDWLSRN